MLESISKSKWWALNESWFHFIPHMISIFWLHPCLYWALIVILYELSGYNSPTMIVCSLRWFLLPVPACDLSPHGSSVNHLIPPLPDNERIVWCTSIINVWNSHQLPPPVTCHCYWVNTILPNTFLKTFWKINFNSDILVFHLRQTRQNMPTLTI